MISVMQHWQPHIDRYIRWIETLLINYADLPDGLVRFAHSVIFY